ncbi:MAG: zf-HC2 domain-containing protein [Treponema sp.]|nr:zf-HC2 domain-containing protein [Treponema sp.]
MMCPDRQLLSAYFDGEVPSPWKEKIEKHISNCPSCKEQLGTYKALSIELASDTEISGKAAQDRVWLSMEQRFGTESLSAQSRTTGRTSTSRTLWQRRVSIPIPAAAAAVAAVALLFVALAFVLGTRVPVATETPGMAILPDDDFDMPAIIPVSDMNDVLQYLGIRDAGELLIMQLPESRNFVTNGEPAIIRAADYSQQVSNQQIPGQGTQRRRR